MKRSRLLLALVLLVGFVFVVQRGVSLAADSSGNGQIASLTVVLPTPTPKPTIDALHPHPCAAVASGNQVAKLATDSGLTFSEIPQRWILEGRSPWLWVGDWLADDRSVLLTQWHIPLGGYLGYEEITLLDTQSGEIHTLGGRYSPENRGQPFWLEDMQQVGFVGIQPRAIEDWVPYDERPPTDLWLGVSGTITLTEPILQNVLAATGRGHEIVAFQQDPARFTWRDLFTNEEKILDLSNSPYSLQYSKQEGEMTWHVSLPLVAYYGMKGLYILDLATFTLSKVTLDTDQRPGYSTSPYPLTAKWHPTDGRIAVIAAYDDEITWDVDGTFDHISWSPQLLLLDAEKRICVIDLPAGLTPTDIAWVAESDRIVVYGQHANPLESDAYLVDTRDGSVQPIASLPKGNGGAMAGRNFALSPNGEHAVLYQPHRFQIFAVSETLKLPMTNTLEIAPSKTITTAREQSKEYLQQYSFAQRDISGLPNQENVSLEGWLPDSETLIQTYYENNPAFPLSDQIQTWDSRTGQIANFGWARTVWFFRAPFWLDSIDSMGYVGPIGEYHLLLSGLANQNLWIAQAGTVTTTTPALSNIVAATGRDETVIALTSQPRQMVEYNVITKQTRVLPVDVGDIGSPLQNGDSDYDVVMKWHPTLPLVAISSGATFSVYNTEAETLSRLSLGMPSVVFDALPTASNFSWNPVEPELVVYVTDARFTMAGRKEWMILNAETGLLTPLVFWDYQITGAVWAPNGRDLLLFAHDENWAAPFMPQALLFDTKIGVWVQLDDLVEATDTQGAIYEAFWSPDGERLALQYIDRRYIFDATLPPSGAVR